MQLILKSIPLVFVCLSPAIVFADILSPVQVMMMQVSLKEHGLYSGSPSGKIGAETISALDAFASKYSAPSSPDGAYRFMVQKSLEASIPISDPELTQKVTEATREKAAAASITVSNLRQIDSPSAPIICGEATIGDESPKTFYGLFFPKNGTYIPGGIDDATSPPIVALRCSLTFR